MAGRRTVLWIGFCCLMTISVKAQTQDSTEIWTPINKAAQSVTGQVTLTRTEVTFQNGKTLPLSYSQMLFRAEKKKKKVMAELYRITQPEDLALENGNKLSTKPAVYLIVWHSPKVGKDIDQRTMAAFSGPNFDPGSPDECGRFVYDASDR